MKRFFVILFGAFLFFSCAEQMREENIPLPNLSFSDQWDVGYDNVTISCTVSGNMTAERLLLEYGTDESLSQPQSETFNNQGKDFALSLTGLESQTTYYYRYTVENKISTYTDSDIRQFTTRSYSSPTIITLDADAISGTHATLKSQLEDTGGKPIIEHGFLFGEDQANMGKRSVTSQDWTLELEDLGFGTTYYYQAYAISEIGTGTGDVKVFTTCNAVIFKPVEVKDISATSAVVIGGIESDGGVTIETQGFRLKMDGASDYSFIPSEVEATLSDLKPETKYTVWYYAKTFEGEFESKTVEFQTTSSEPEAVDLGLPSGIKWASYNVGATKPEEYGDYFAWGETSPKSDYSWSTYKWYNGSGTTLTKYNTRSGYGTVDNKTQLELSDDAARVNWGGKWRMPTKAEFEELKSNCTYTWTTTNGVNGYLFTSKKNGNSIFLPAAGYLNGAFVNYAGSYGYYWSSSLHTDNPSYARYLFIYSSSINTDYYYRFYGQSVRPVYGDLISVISVSLSQTTLTLEVGETATLTATVKPDNATDKTVTWTSSNTSAATVDSGGVVTAKSGGTATITAIAGNRSATCTVTVNQPNSGPEAVDLGLPSGIKWASYNVGATKPEEYGDYFAWGETSPKSDYSWSTYKWCKGSYNTLTKYNSTGTTYVTVDNKMQLEMTDDAARANWGGNWRMPTKAEFDELRTYCNHTWTTRNGVKGYLVTSNKNGNSIFLPAAGYRYGTSVDKAGSNGDYWSSSVYTADFNEAWHLYSYSSSFRTYYGRRANGLSVRPVYGDLISVTSVSLSQTTLTLEVGEYATLTATVTPDNASDKTVSWTSSNTSVATVSNGTVTAVAAGTATITAKAGDKTATCTVTAKDNKSLPSKAFMFNYNAKEYNSSTYTFPKTSGQLVLLAGSRHGKIFPLILIFESRHR